MEEHGINSATLIVHSVKSRDSITWSQDSTVILYKYSIIIIINHSLVLCSQATATHGPVVERARAWCHMLGVPDYRFSSPMSSNVGLDETDDRILVKMIWETRVYVLQNFKDFTD